MELKRIIARDSRAANEKAIALYGPDVLVISSQRVDSQTELIVAIDTDLDAAAAPQKTSPAPQPDKAQERFQAFSDVFKVSIEGGAHVPDAVAAVPPAEDEWVPAALRLAQQAPAPAPASAPTVQVAAPVMPEPAPVQVALPVQTPAQTPEPVQAQDEVQPSAELRRSHDTVELLRQEIAALRQEFSLNRQVAMWQSGQGLSPELTQWFAHMQELGVPASLRTLMVDATADCSTVSEAWPRIHQTLVAATQRRKSAWPQKGVHALIGPSGAGKSLMVARMALATAAQVGVDDMAIISLADTRPGAWSQLQVLAAQSGVTCYRAADGAALEVLLQELSHLRLVWIDTPGTDFMAQARALQTASTAVSLHAVLPLDATVTNVRKIFEPSEAHWASVMLTKLDEAAHPWPVLKALCDRPLAVSAVGASHLARVAPEPFDARVLVDLSLEGLRPQGVVAAAVAPVKTVRRRAVAAVTPATAPVAVAKTASRAKAKAAPAAQIEVDALAMQAAAIPAARARRTTKAKTVHG